MVEYKCQKCEKNFAKKDAYTKHMNRKIPCDNVKESIHSKMERLEQRVAEMEKERQEKTEKVIKRMSEIYVLTGEEEDTSDALQRIL